MSNFIKSNQESKDFLENNEEKLLEYIGEKGEYYLNIFKGPKNKLNFCGLFFGPLWMGYRQMYFEAFIYGCVVSLLGLLIIIFDFSNSYTKSLSYVIEAMVGIFGNELYFSSLRERITKGDKKIGVSGIGIIYGFILGILMPMVIFIITIFVLVFLL